VLVVPDGGRPEAVRRDVAIVGALRALEPGVAVDWLAPPPVRAWLASNGEAVHPASDGLLPETSIDGTAVDGPADLAAHRRFDEARFVNFMVFADLVAAEPVDLVVADGAWQVDHYLHQHPELKQFAFAWLTDRVGWAPAGEETEREAALRTDANQEMVELVERHARLRDLALFIGDPGDIPDIPLGVGFPSMRAWTERRFAFVPVDTARSGEAQGIAKRLRALI
jgi:hypothetical protein